MTAGALRDARDDFGFLTESDVIQFIADGGLGDVVFKGTKPLEQWDGDPPAPEVHAFGVLVGKKEAYLAYYEGTLRCIVKSFKLDGNPPVRRPPTRSPKRWP